MIVLGFILLNVAYVYVAEWLTRGAYDGIFASYLTLIGWAVVNLSYIVWTW